MSWGYDAYGQVSLTPTGTNFTAVASGFFHSLALRADGSIASWGYDGNLQVSRTPTGTGFTAIAADEQYSLALRADGSIASWGADIGGVVSRTPGSKGFTAISAGGVYCMALRFDGSIASWGDDSFGEVSKTPIGIGFKAIAAGGSHSLALRFDGSIASWGNDNNGQVSRTPAGTGFTAVAAGAGVSLALRADGSIVSWGSDGFGQVSRTPAGTGFTAIDAGLRSCAALRADGSIVSWGTDNNGQVSRTPAGTGFTAVAVGDDHGVALRSSILHGIDASQDLNWPTVSGLYHPSFLIAAAWGGKTTFPVPARVRLAAAPAGTLKAAYCLLNFDQVSQNGAWQVQQGIAAIGNQIEQIQFIAVDVEFDGNVNTLPLGPYARAQRVAEGVQAVLDAGKRPVIYTPSAHWAEITGSSTAFKAFPLWHAAYAANSGKTPDQWDDRLDGFAPFGGWTTRAGRQYVDYQTAGHDVDLNVFDPSVFDPNYTRPPAAREVPSKSWAQASPNAQVEVTGTGLTLTYISRNPIRIVRAGSVTIRNIGTQTIAGPLQLVVTNLTPGFTLAYASGDRGSGPYLILPLPQEGLQPGGPPVTVQVLFSGNNTQLVNYLPRVFSGYW